MFYKITIPGGLYLFSIDDLINSLISRKSLSPSEESSKEDSNIVENENKELDLIYKKIFNQSSIITLNTMDVVDMLLAMTVLSGEDLADDEIYNFVLSLISMETTHLLSVVVLAYSGLINYKTVHRIINSPSNTRTQELVKLLREKKSTSSETQITLESLLMAFNVQLRYLVEDTQARDITSRRRLDKNINIGKFNLIEYGTTIRKNALTNFVMSLWYSAMPNFNITSTIQILNSDGTQEEVTPWVSRRIINWTLNSSNWDRWMDVDDDFIIGFLDSRLNVDGSSNKSYHRSLESSTSYLSEVLSTHSFLSVLNKDIDLNNRDIKDKLLKPAIEAMGENLNTGEISDKLTNMNGVKMIELLYDNTETILSDKEPISLIEELKNKLNSEVRIIYANNDKRKLLLDYMNNVLQNEDRSPFSTLEIKDGLLPHFAKVFEYDFKDTDTRIPLTETKLVKRKWYDPKNLQFSFFEKTFKKPPLSITPIKVGYSRDFEKIIDNDRKQILLEYKKLIKLPYAAEKNLNPVFGGRYIIGGKKFDPVSKLLPDRVVDLEVLPEGVRLHRMSNEINFQEKLTNFLDTFDYSGVTLNGDLGDGSAKDYILNFGRRGNELDNDYESVKTYLLDLQKIVTSSNITRSDNILDDLKDYLQQFVSLKAFYDLLDYLLDSKIPINSKDSIKYKIGKQVMKVSDDSPFIEDIRLLSSIKAIENYVINFGELVNIAEREKDFIISQTFKKSIGEIDARPLFNLMTFNHGQAHNILISNFEIIESNRG